MGNAQADAQPSQPDTAHDADTGESLIVAFYPQRTTGCEHGFTNCVLSCLSKLVAPKFEHCNLAFITVNKLSGKVSSKMTYSMTKSDHFGIPNVGYTDDLWHIFRWRAVSHSQIEKVRAWCNAKLDTRFNTSAFLINFLPCTIAFCAVNARGKRMFCAESVVLALRAGDRNILPQLTPYLCTTDQLYYALVEDESNFQRISLRDEGQPFYEL